MDRGLQPASTSSAGQGVNAALSLFMAVRIAFSVYSLFLLFTFAFNKTNNRAHGFRTTPFPGTRRQCVPGSTFAQPTPSRKRSGTRFKITRSEERRVGK